jgi:phosphatidylethanolamine-binding protein (PEBP) family uncharacterized protein
VIHNSSSSPSKRPKTGLSFLCVLAASAVILGLPACSTEDPGTDTGTGGSSSGGATASGGSASGGAGSGGAPTGSGGRTASGGAASGGGQATGGDAATGGDTASGGGDGSGGDEGGGEFTLTSTAFADGEEIPSDHTCAGGGGQMNWGEGPPLVWTGVPEGTMSFAFFMIDDTLTTKQPPDQNGYHSAAWNIPTTITELPQGFGPSDLGGATAINGAYLGPCPNLITQGNTDIYKLHVLALPMASYTINGSGTAGVRMAWETLSAVALGDAVLSGTSDAVQGQP